MRGSEVNINLSEMKEWTSALKSSDTMKIIALENGDIAMGAELRKSMSEKMADAWKIKLYATDDMKILAVHPDINSDFRYPKNGRRKFKSYVESLKNKGYKIPATYNVEWNEKIQSWVGILQEVAESYYGRLREPSSKSRNITGSSRKSAIYKWKEKKCEIKFLVTKKIRLTDFYMICIYCGAETLMKICV